MAIRALEILGIHETPEVLMQRPGLWDLPMNPQARQGQTILGYYLVQSESIAREIIKRPDMIGMPVVPPAELTKCRLKDQNYSLVGILAAFAHIDLIPELAERKELWRQKIQDLFHGSEGQGGPYMESGLSLTLHHKKNQIEKPWFELAPESGALFLLEFSLVHEPFKEMRTVSSNLSADIPGKLKMCKIY